MVQPSTKPTTESSAIVALVLGIAGLFVLPVILSIPAVIVGKSAEKKIQSSGGTLGGSELAKAGVICGWIGIALGILGIIAVIVVVAVGLASGAGTV